MTTRAFLLSAWDPGFAVPAACIAALAAYGIHYRRRLGSRAIFFVLAIAIAFVALASPIGVLARGVLFSAHMLQHLLLLLAVPPLVLLGQPRSSRREDAAPREGDARREGAAPREGGAAWGYLVPWAAGVGGMWIWHARPLCNAAATSPGVQALQSVSLIMMGFAFWRPILVSRRSDRLPPFAAMLYLFAACAACTLLGILITFSPVEVCSAYLNPTDAPGVVAMVRGQWGLSCKADQEIGGLLMWVPACLVYVAAILATLGRYYDEEQTSEAAMRGAS
jgi:putative membrane protein